ncbi:MAG: hypothetical protein K2X49_11815 [Acetobacteraceae bacterium]|nr:hypothetical protein [Acetobacteraceae bacterium]
MRWRLPGLVLPALLLLGACTPLPTLGERLQPWIGRSELDLVSAFGVPSGTYEVEGTKFLQFVQQRTIFAPADYPYYRPYGRFGPLMGPAFPPTVVVGCEVTFALRRGVVESFSFRGEGCR